MLEFKSHFIAKAPLEGESREAWFKQERLETLKNNRVLFFLCSLVHLYFFIQVDPKRGLD